MRLFVSAGEASGDLILAAILRELRARVPDLAPRGLGGEASAREGLRPLLPLARTAVSGIGDVLARAVSLARMRSAAFACLEASPRPDLALLVDYPGLNLRLAARARALGIPVWYVAPPQAWLYRDPERKAARARRFLRGCGVQVIFPFERGTFAPGAARVACGHFLETGPEPRDGRDHLLLCPGSREGALRRNLPAWLRALEGAGILPGGADRPSAAPAARGIGGAAVLVPPHLAAEAERIAVAHARAGGGGGRPPRVTTDKEGILRVTRWALAFPGTMTLELALRGVPAAVVAAADPLTLIAGRRLLRGPWLGLPNLLLEREAFPEWAGRPGALAPAVAAGLWERLRGLDGAEEARTLRDLLGPSTGARTAAEGCLEILGRTVTHLKTGNPGP